MLSELLWGLEAVLSWGEIASLGVMITLLGGLLGIGLATRHWLAQRERCAANVTKEEEQVDKGVMGERALGSPQRDDLLPTVHYLLTVCQPLATNPLMPLSLREDAQAALQGARHLWALLHHDEPDPQPRASSFEMAPLLQELKSHFRPWAQEKQLEWVASWPFDLPAIFYGDEQRLRRVLYHLLVEAFWATRSGQVVLGVAVVEEPPPASALVSAELRPLTLRFTVRDTRLRRSIDLDETLSWHEQPMPRSDIWQRWFSGLGAQLQTEWRLGEGLNRIFYVNLHHYTTIERGETAEQRPLLTALAAEQRARKYNKEYNQATFEALSAQSVKHSAMARGLQTLRKAIETLDVEAIDGAIDALEPLDRALTQELRKMAREFRYPDMLELIRHD